MLHSTRRHDDADVIRARLRRLLADANASSGWLPDDDPSALPVQPSVRPSAEPAVADTSDGPALPAGIGRHRSPGPTVRWSPGRAGVRSLWIAGITAALALVVWTWIDRPRVDPAPASEPASAASTVLPPSEPVDEVSAASPEVVVSVVGLVARPGLVTLPSGARVADAVEAVGGLLPEADATAVNLAAVVSDGEQIAVGVPGAGPPAAAGVGGRSDGLVDLNTATVGELDGLPGIGPVLAQRIVDHRTGSGPFRSVDELDDVPGIGPSTAAELAAQVTV